MAKFIIEWSEKKVTSTGKEKIDATLKDEAGVTTDKVTIWSDFPNFAGLMTGGSVEGDLVPAKDPKWGPTLYPPKPVATNVGYPRRSGGANTVAIQEAQETKARNIEQAQDRSAWMWAKNNASQLISSTNYIGRNLDSQQMVDLVLEIATKIYNGEPLEPFN